MSFLSTPPRKAATFAALAALIAGPTFAFTANGAPGDSASPSSVAGQATEPATGGAQQGNPTVRYLSYRITGRETGNGKLSYSPEQKQSIEQAISKVNTDPALGPVVQIVPASPGMPADITYVPTDPLNYPKGGKIAAGGWTHSPRAKNKPISTDGVVIEVDFQQIAEYAPWRDLDAVPLHETLHALGAGHGDYVLGTPEQVDAAKAKLSQASDDYNTARDELTKEIQDGIQLLDAKAESLTEEYGRKMGSTPADRTAYLEAVNLIDEEIAREKRRVEDLTADSPVLQAKAKEKQTAAEELKKIFVEKGRCDIMGPTDLPTDCPPEATIPAPLAQQLRAEWSTPTSPHYWREKTDFSAPVASTSSPATDPNPLQPVDPSPEVFNGQESGEIEF